MSPSIEQSHVLSTINEDGSAEFTVALANDDHKFSVSHNGETAYVSYEESLSWRSQVRTCEPNEPIWRLLMRSERVTDYLDSHGLSGIKRTH